MEGSFCLGIFIILETRVQKASESHLEIMEVVFSSLNADQTLSWSFEAQTIHVPSHQKKPDHLWSFEQYNQDMAVRKPPSKTCHVLILQTIQARHFLINSAIAPTVLLIGCIAGGVRILKISLLECMEPHMVHWNKINLARPKLMSLAD